MDKACEFCGARFWIEERTGGSVRQPTYSKCCAGGKVAIPRICTPPDFLAMLRTVRNGELRKNIRSYNAAFAFTLTRVQSVGFELGPRVHTYRVHGGYYHMIGGMEPEDGQISCFLQAYVYDAANEVQNRQLRNPNFSQVTLMAIRDILGRYNPYVRIFERAVDRLAAHPVEEVRVVLTAVRNHGSEMDPCQYNAPMADEVAMILPRDPGQIGNRDFIVEQRHGGGLLRMSELAPSYDPLQYPLLFLAWEDGWAEGMQLRNNVGGTRQRVTMVAFYAQRLHFTREPSALHYGGRLFQ